jgi:hypothetical protein
MRQGVAPLTRAYHCALAVRERVAERHHAPEAGKPWVQIEAEGP